MLNQTPPHPGFAVTTIRSVYSDFTFLTPPPKHLRRRRQRSVKTLVLIMSRVPLVQWNKNILDCKYQNLTKVPLINFWKGWLKSPNKSTYWDDGSWSNHNFYLIGLAVEMVFVRYNLIWQGIIKAPQWRPSIS